MKIHQHLTHKFNIDRPLAQKVSQAHINFASTGNLNHSGLSRWEAYTKKKGATVVLDNGCAIRNHPDQKITGVQ
ncbi:MAG: para-nitrobenzyl esterase [Limisphaerales bacterium]